MHSMKTDRHTFNTKETKRRKNKFLMHKTQDYNSSPYPMQRAGINGVMMLFSNRRDATQERCDAKQMKALRTAYERFVVVFQSQSLWPNILHLDTCCLLLVAAVGALWCWSPWAVIGGRQREDCLAILACGGNHGKWCPHQYRERMYHPSSLVEERLDGLGLLGLAACSRLG